MLSRNAAALLRIRITTLSGLYSDSQSHGPVGSLQFVPAFAAPCCDLGM
jgi:hypothetical protein